MVVVLLRRQSWELSPERKPSAEAAEAQMKPVPSGMGARVCHSFSRVHIRLVAFALPCRPLGLRKCNKDQHTEAQHRMDDNIGRRVGRRGDQARLVESHGVHHVEGEHNARRNAGPAGCSGDGRDHGSIHQIRSSETPVGQLRPSPQHLDDYSSICALLHFLNHRRGELMESVEPEPEERVKYDTQ